MKYINEKRYIIETAIGLQDVDHLKNSEYFLKLTNRYLNDEISLDELDQYISSYYKTKSDIESRTKEADLVATRISILLSKEVEFSLSIKQLLSIHRYLFGGLLEHPGVFRIYNIQKREWVLNSDTVTYGDYRSLYDTIEYDLGVEKSNDYTKLNDDQKIEHLAKFISNLWQDHPFSEGNTRTATVFLILYLRSLGFDVNNDIFSKNAWYFRNALVRANYSNFEESIFEDKSFIIKFLRNLLLNEDNKLSNRELHINETIKKYKNREKFNPTQKILLDLMKNNPNIKTDELAKYMNVSLRTIKNVIHLMEEKNIVKRVNGKKYGHWEVNDD